MAILNRLTKLKLALTASSVLFSISTMAASSTQVQFDGLIGYEGGCDITVKSPIIFNHGDEVLPSQIVAKAAVTKESFELTLANCKGVKVTPKIIVTGNINREYGENLFLDKTASSAVGYGFLLATPGNTTFQPNANLATNNVISAVKSWDANTKLDTINGTLPLTATLSCGNCTAQDRVGGDLKANVTFDFQYE